MSLARATTLRTRLTIYYIGVLAALLIVYALFIFAFQYAVLTRQMFHDEVQDIVTVEGLLYFDAHGQLKLRQDYYSRPQSHLLLDRLMEVRDAASGDVLYRSPTLKGMSLGNGLRPGEGDRGFDEQRMRLADGTHVFVVSHVHGMDGKSLVIRLAYSFNPFRERMRGFLFLLLPGIPVVLLIAGAGGQGIARRALQPLGKMTAHAGSITAHNLHDRLEVLNPQDELGQMATVFNGLLQRLEQAFAQLQHFTADAAHEMRTPLAALRAMGEVAIQKDQTAEDYRNIIGSILEEASRLNRIIDSLLLLARAEASESSEQKTHFALKPLVDDVLGLLEILIEERGVEVVETGSCGASEVEADRLLLRQAVLNVLHNALKFSPQDSVLTIEYSMEETASGFVVLTIQDQGPGIPKGFEDRVFERFVTSPSSAQGTGLGLAVARLVIERAGGTIQFVPDVKTGARCRIRLPLYSSDVL